MNLQTDSDIGVAKQVAYYMFTLQLALQRYEK